MKRNPRRDILIGLAASVFGNFTPASTTATTTPGPWDLYSGTSKVSTHKTEAACVTAAVTRAAARTYTCRTRTGVVVTVKADPPPVPAPVDCAVSEWGAWAAGPWSTCSSASQSRAETRTRTVVTPAASGGAACPSLSESRSVTQACADPVPEPLPSGDVVFASPPTADMAALKPGQTLVLRAGSYSSLKVKACTADRWCTVRAEVDGTVTFGSLSVAPGSWYTSFEGVKFKSTSGSRIDGSFVKLRRVAFDGGPSSGNSASLTVGSNDRTPGASDILLEDVWVYGAGGRYKVLVYNAQRVVLRRVIARHDGGWTYDSRNPQGGFSLYDSRDVACQNCMFVDSVSALSGFEAALYLVSNGTTSTKQSNVTVAGSILIGSPNNGLAAEGQSAASYTVSDLVVTGSKQGAVNTNGAAHTLTVTGLTANVAGTAIARWASSGSLRVTNCKIVKGTASSGATLSNCPGGTGATLQRIGVDGTMFGEAGFDQPRGELWPWPNETRIKADFDSVRQAFGGKTLSEYARP